VLAALFGLLASSWLGVLTFQGDGVQDRIRFLAERGVSPAKIWWTRHALPLSLLAVALFGFVFFLPAGFAAARSSPSLILSIVVAILCAYAVSQAVSQVFRSSTIAAIAAPAVVWMLAAYGGSLVTLLGVPLLAAGCVRFASLASDVPDDAALDGRSLGVGLLGLARRFSCRRHGVAAGPGRAGLGFTTDHARGGAPAVDGRGAELRHNVCRTAELVLRFRNPAAPDAPPADRRLEGRIVCEQLEHDLSLGLGPIRFVPRVMVYLLGEARLARMSLEQEGDPESNRERYRGTLTLIGTMIERLRLSWRMVDQDGADLTEIWMVNELAASKTESWLGPKVYGRLVRTVGDEKGRNASRRRALVMSWAAYRTQSHMPESLIGGYAWRGETTSILFRVNPFLRRRAADDLIWRMLQRLQRSEAAESVERTKELARYWGVPELYYGLGPHGEYLRADNVTAFAMPVEGFFRSAPGSQWHAGWERAARELASNG